MESRQDNSDGSDIFWPGYVDATTNLILNLLFLLTILIVAVFMFALELGRASKFESNKAPVATTKVESAAASKAIDSAGENIALKREIKRLNMLLAEKAAQDVQSAGSAKTIEAKFDMPKPVKGLDQTLAYESEIVVHFKDEAVTFSAAEHDQLFDSMKPVANRENVGIYVEVPAGFSEAKRMGFYRAMAVRNILIELKVPNENIHVSVVEGNSNPNASIVRIRTH